jgi:4-aminobutyrate aminotransferase/(S)-3-amino-2-methylpropionate transaminase
MPTKSLTPASRAFSFTIPGEPSGPSVKTQMPGPKNVELTNKLGDVACNLMTHVGFTVDVQKSKGHYVADADGNVLLDLFMNISSNAMGHMNQDVLDFARTDEVVMQVANRTVNGYHPDVNFKDILDEAFISVAPPGMNRVSSSICGSCATETAMKHAIAKYAHDKRGGMDMMPEDMDHWLNSCMNNEAPGTPNYAIMSVRGGFHGRLFGSLSASTSKAIMKMDVPAFDWPKMDAPLYKYPLADNAEYNHQQDLKSLKSMEDNIKRYEEEKGIEVAAIIIEPILAEGGDINCSNWFMNEIRNRTKAMGKYMIIDEVQTGVVTSGKFWAHENF